MAMRFTAALPVLFAFITALQAAEGSWISLAPMSDPRQEVAVAEVGGLIYAVGGLPRTNRVQQYNPASDSWRIVAPLPISVDHAGAAGAAGKLYVMGGSTDNGDSSALFEYDPAADRWTQKAAMPTARNALAAGVIDGKVYAVGGTSATQRDLEVYDPTLDSWTRLAPMVNGRNHLAAAAIAGKLYVVGGRNNVDFTQTALEVYDPSLGRWTTLAPMPTGRSGHGAAALNGRLYVFGGEGNARHPLGVFPESEVYDPAANAWASLDPMPTPRHGIGAAALGNRIYVPAGATREGGGTHTGVNEAFVVQPEKTAFAFFVTSNSLASELYLGGNGNGRSSLVELEFRDQSGQDAGGLGIQPLGSSSILSRNGGKPVLEVPAEGTAAFRLTTPTGPLGSALRIRWIQISSEHPVSGLLFIGNSLPGLTPARLLAAQSFPVRFDASTALGCAIAIANPGASLAAITLVLRGQTGTELSRAELSVPAGGEIADLLEKIFPSAVLGPNFTGTVSAQSSTPVATLALLFRGDTLTHLPVSGE